MGAGGPYINIVEDPYDHPEWIELDHVGTGTPGFMKIEYEVNTGQVRVSGPYIVGNQHINPAP